MNNLFPIPDKEKHYQSYMVYVLTLLWGVTNGVIVSLGFIFFPLIWVRWLTFLGVSVAITLLNITLNRRGYTGQASWTLTIMVWLFITIPCYSAGGIIAPGIMSQMSVILTAGFLLGWRGGVTVGLVTLVADFGLVYLQITGRLPEPTVVHTPITRWIGNIIPFGTIFALQYYATNHLHTGLKALRREIIKREEAEEIKDKILNDLGERIKELRTLYAVSRILQDDDVDPEKAFREIATVIPSGWKYPNEAACRVWIDNTEYQSDNYKSSEDRLHAEMKTSKGTAVGIEVTYLQSLPRQDEGPFLKEERSLLNVLTGMLKTDLDRRERRAELTENEQRIRKITSQVPGNTYVFEIEETGLTQTLFFNRGTEEINHKVDLMDLQSAAVKLVDLIHEEDQSRWVDAMKEGVRSQTDISVQYRMMLNDQLRWRWFRAVPELTKDGKLIWYGASQDITPLVKYIVSVEQVLFDISHVIRRPVSSIRGLTNLLSSDKLSEGEIREIGRKINGVANEMDKFLQELNADYDKSQKENALLNFDFGRLIDKRSSLFG